MKSQSFTISCALALCCLLTIGTPLSAAEDITGYKLFGRWSGTGAASSMGASAASTAMTAKWIAVGAAESAGGAVQVFNAATGAWVRRISAPGPASAQRFGQSVAISGDLAVVGAPQLNTSTGAAYIVNLATGALIRTLSASDGAPGFSFGASVAVAGNFAFVGAPGRDAARGAVYVCNLTTGGQLIRLVADDDDAGDAFGTALAAEGLILAAGAPGDNGNTGAVYFFDISGQQIKKHVPQGAAAASSVGAALSMHQGRVAIGTQNATTTTAYWHNLVPANGEDDDQALTFPGVASALGTSVAICGSIVAVGDPAAVSGDGQVHLFRAADATFLSTLSEPQGGFLKEAFGSSVALFNGSLLATVPLDNAAANSGGAAFLYRPILQPMPYPKAVAKGDFVARMVDASYGKFRDVYVNNQAELLFGSTLAGSGTAGGKTNACFTDMSSPSVPWPFALAAAPAATVPVAINDGDLAIMRYLTNNIHVVTNGSNTAVLEVGKPVQPLDGGKLATVPEVVGSIDFGQRRMAAICTLKQEAGAGITATNDSGMWLYTAPAAPGGLPEGTPAPVTLPPGSFLGQFSPRLSFHFGRQIYSTALIGINITPTINGALFSRTAAGTVSVVAQKGDVAVDAAEAPLGNAKYSAFIGESSNDTDDTFYRATLTGPSPDVRPTTNEGIWLREPGSSSRLMLRKGDSPNGGVSVISRFNAFWGAPGHRLVALVTLTGGGVTAATDLAFAFVQEDGVPVVLMQEGQGAPGYPGAKIGTILRVEFDSYNGRYALLASLTGSPKDANLALFTGSVKRGNALEQTTLRTPFLRLLKGDRYDNQPSKILSIALPTGNLPSSGAGCVGRGRAISWDGDFAFNVDYASGVCHVVKGRAD